MTNDILQLALALGAGAILGALFFGGLWLTVQILPTTRWPVLVAFGSMMGRIGVAVLGFYLIMDGSWQRLLACLVGFILMRQALIRWLRPPQTRLQAVDQG